MRFIGGCTAAGLISYAAAGAGAAVVSVPASQDNTLYESPTGALSNGAGTGMFAGRTSQTSNSVRRGLIRFDVAAAVPVGSIITGATLTLHQSSANDDVRTVSLHIVNQQWGEGASNATTGNGGGGAPAQPGDATWLHRSFNTVFWASFGGSFSPMPSAAAPVGGNGAYAWSSAQLAADVQAFLDDPSANFGWLLLGDESASGTSKRFSTREEPDESLRPMLTVEYIVPSPASIALAAPMIFSASRRRRAARSGERTKQ